MPIKLRKEVRFAELLTPLKDYATEKQPIEHRYDPLTGPELLRAKARRVFLNRPLPPDTTPIRSSS